MNDGKNKGKSKVNNAKRPRPDGRRRQPDDRRKGEWVREAEQGKLTRGKKGADMRGRRGAKNKGRKTMSEKEKMLISEKEYGDEFYTDEVELKRRRAKQRHQAQQIDDMDFEKAPMSHRRRRLKNVGIAAAIVSGFLAIGIALSLTVFFRSEKFTVEGAEHYSDQDIISASGLTLGENLFLSDKKSGEDRIESMLPYVEEAKISVRIPNTMLITVTESKPAFLIESGEGYIVASKQGKVLEKTNETPDKFDAPVVKGCTVKVSEVGQDIKFKESGMLSIIKSVTQAIADNEFSGIKEIDASSAARIAINYSDRIKIIIGLPEDISYKLKTAKIIISEKLSETDRGELDVSSCKDENKRSYFRPNPAIYLENATETQPATEAETTADSSQSDGSSDGGDTYTYDYSGSSSEDYGYDYSDDGDSNVDYSNDGSSEDYSDGVPRYTYPTDAYGNVISSSSASEDYDTNYTFTPNEDIY